MKRGSFVVGFLTGLLVVGVTTTAYAAGIMAERSTHRVFVDGREVQMEAYRIKGNNYVKLRDIGRAVGFNIYWDSDSKCVQVESDKPYTGEAPVKSTTTKSVEQPAQTDVAVAKQNIIDRTNALRKENGIATSSCRRRRCEPMKWPPAAHIPTPGQTVANMLPSPTVNMWAKIFTAWRSGP